MSEQVYQGISLTRPLRWQGLTRWVCFLHEARQPVRGSQCGQSGVVPIAVVVKAGEAQALSDSIPPPRLAFAAGESPEWIAKQLGHNSTQMLFRVYSRYVPDLSGRDGHAFEQMLAGFEQQRLALKALAERWDLHDGEGGSWYTSLNMRIAAN